MNLMRGLLAATVGAVLVMSADVSKAADPVTAGNVTVTSSGATFGNFYGYVSSYFTVAVDSIWSGSFSYAISSGGYLIGQLFNVTDSNVVASTGLLSTATVSSSFSDTVSLIAGKTYQVSLTGANSTVSNLSQSVTAVPGPVAAAGLPGVLALMGFGLYRRRRNSQSSGVSSA